MCRPRVLGSFRRAFSLCAAGLLCLVFANTGRASSEDPEAWSPSFSFFTGAPATTRDAAAAPAASATPLPAAPPPCAASVSSECLVPRADVVAGRAPEPSTAGEGSPRDPARLPAVPAMSPDPDAPQVLAARTSDAHGSQALAPVSPDPDAPRVLAAVSPAILATPRAAASTPPPPRTEEPAARRDETELWVPSLSFFGAGVMQDAKGRSSTSDLMANTDTAAHLCETDPLCVRPSASGSDLQVTPIVGASLELMTPGIQDVPGRPRAFVHTDAAAAFSPNRFLAREGVVEPFDGNPSGLETVEEEFVIGQGSQTTAWVKTLLLTGGVGVAFTTELGSRRVRIKPSVEYLREKVQAEGAVNRVVSMRGPPPPPQTTPPAGTCTSAPDKGIPPLTGCRTIQLRGKKDQAFQGVGPGLEIEMDAARAGPVVFSVYTAGAAYRMLGDLDFRFSDEDDLGESAEWSYEKDDWSYRAGVGFRMRYVPED